MSSFTADVYQNEYLPADGSEVHAILTVTSTKGGDPARQPEAAEIVIVDTSGSMDVPRVKMKAAREATSVAIDCIRDGVAFAVIAGSGEARMVYPSEARLVSASETRRDEAKRAVSRLKAGGGTAIGTWLGLAGRVFDTAQGRVGHAVLLTDGENEHESPEQLEAILAECEGRFQCDCRGVGTDWKVSELRRIASTLLGTVDIIADPADMAQDFRSMIETAMGKATQSVSLRVWTGQKAQVSFLRQVSPTIEELTDRAVPVNALMADYPTGSWGEESRDYHVCIKVQPQNLGDEMLAARVSLVEGDEVLGQALIKAIWSDDQQLSTRINREVAHYTGQAELAGCIQDGLKARKAGDEGTAKLRLGRAVQLASEGGNDGQLKQLQTVVDVIDAATGTVQLRRQVQDADEMALDTRSTKTVRVRPGT
jgi:von Willebrand factor type A C-terminal domain/von Willebrand factor type A domain